MFARKPTRKLADLEVILEDLFADTSPDPMVTLRFPEDGAVVQFLREDDTLDLYLNTSGTAGSIGKIRSAAVVAWATTATTGSRRVLATIASPGSAAGAPQRAALRR
jgi:hypothetical protein